MQGIEESKIPAGEDNNVTLDMAEGSVAEIKPEEPKRHKRARVLSSSTDQSDDEEFNPGNSAKMQKHRE